MKEAKLYIVLFMIFAVAWGCTEYNTIIVPNNTPPPDPTVANVLRENYITKTYINVLGRKPTDTEFQSGVALLEMDNASAENRLEFLQGIFVRPEYKNREYELARDQLVSSADTTVFIQYYALLEFQLQLTTDPILIARINEEKARIQNVLVIPQAYGADQIDIIEVHKRLVNNLIYDEINMGTENFVVSVFQNQILRTPTSDESAEFNELANASAMVNGFPSVLFLKVGDSKDDFIEIVHGAADYFEGQIRRQYLRFLFREPTTTELAEKVDQYISDGDYIQIQTDILVSDEYLGIE